MKQVIVVRTDLKMSKGKIAAQSAHASVSAMEKAKKSIIDEWKDTGQKKIVLKAGSLEELMALKKKCNDMKVPCAVIADAGKTQLSPGTITAIGIGPDDDKKIDKITGTLKIL